MKSYHRFSLAIQALTIILPLLIIIAHYYLTKR